MASALKRPAASPAAAKAASQGSKGQRDPVIPWGAWSQAPGTPNSQDLGELGDDDDDSEDKPKSKSGALSSLKAGFDADGKRLSEDNDGQNSRQQRWIMEKAMEGNPALKEEFDRTTGRLAKRKLINALIDPLANYASRLDAQSCCAHMERIVTRYRRREDEMKEKGKTLTELEAGWGELKVRQGLKRGDVILDPKDNLYYVRTNTRIDTRGATDNMNVHAKAPVEGVDGVRIQDEMAEWSTWAGESEEPVAKRARSSRASSRASSTRGVAPADDETMKYLQSAFDKCSAEMRKGTRLGQQLREVTLVKTTCFRIEEGMLFMLFQCKRSLPLSLEILHYSKNPHPEKLCG